MTDCTECGCRSGAHFSSCPVIGRAIAQMRVDHEAMLEALQKSRAAPATAYDRAQAELNQHLGSLAQMVTSLTLRLDRAHSRIEALEASGLGPHCAACREDHTTVAKRLDAALRRIEALERDIALDRAEAIKSEKRIQALELEVAKLKAPLLTLPTLPEPTLGCGCPGPWCNGHQFSASPATAYPPLSDEGT